ncbi:MAG: ornithine cyclodeaminase [Pseudonocardiales bacterium]|nr:MAG: ornithine cyclodeaminase [Pseudonocardiales bacterium]
MLVLSATEVQSLLDLDALVDAVEAAMIDLSNGWASMPSRVAAVVPERQGMLAAMPAFLPSAGALTTKLVSVFPLNEDRPTHQALICCFDPETGTPVAVMDGTYITASRTAAGSALASRLLARPGASVVAVIGTGVQARAHARALARLPGVRLVRIAGRDASGVQRLVAELVGIPAEAAESVEEAVRSADVVCAATHADRPVVRRDWLRPGTHINAVGYNTSGAGELDVATIADALVVVESCAAALAAPPSGAVELRLAIDQGALDPDRVLEIGQVAADPSVGRSDEAQLTLYKSVGVAVQDAAAAALVLSAAQARGSGTRVSI